MADYETQTQESPPIPSYLLSADNHNLGSSKTSWFESVGASIANAPKFAAVSVLSGLNSFYNTGVKIGKFLGADVEEQKTASVISDLDTDLGIYYRANESSADLMGFVLGSIIPGVAGIKILNAGQKALVAANEGIVGTNLGLALGLRSTKIDAYIKTAASEITQGQAIFSSLGTSGVRALSSGVYQNVLEGIAFETAIQATMMASPILDQQSGKDIFWNVALGGFLGGTIGGAITSAQTFGKISKNVTEIESRIKEFGSRTLQQETGDPAYRIVRNAYDLEHGPVPNPGSPTYVQEVEALKNRQKRIALDIRAETGQLVLGNDVTLARIIADTNVGDLPENMVSRYLHTAEIARVNTPTAVEKEILRSKKAGMVEDPALQVHYWKLNGEDAGTVLGSKPRVLNLADEVSESSSHSTRDNVLSKVKDEKFTVKKLFDPTELSVIGDSGHRSAEARYIWATRILKELPEEAVVHMRDIALLERALADRNISIRLADSTGQIAKEGFVSVQKLEDYIIAVKRDVQERLQEQARKKGSVFKHGADLDKTQDWISQKIGKITNTRVGAMEGTSVGDPRKDYFAWQAAQSEREAFLQARGIKAVEGEEQDIFFLPSYAKVTKRVPKDFIDTSGNQIDALTWIKQQEKLSEEAVDRANAKALGEFFEQLPPRELMDLRTANPKGSGAGLFTFANDSYGSLGSAVQQIGSVVQRASQKFREAFQQQTDGALINLGKDQEAVIEWGGISQKTSRSAKQWILTDDARIAEVFEGRGLIAKEALTPEGNLKEAYATMSLRELEAEGVHIPVVKDQTWDLVKQHVAVTDKRTVASNERAAAQGRQMSKDPGVFRPIPPNPRDYKFFGFVKDPKVSGQGHTSMIFAENPQKLEDLVKKAQGARPDLEIFYKQDTAEFYKARQAYEYDRTLSENYIDSALKNEGIYSDYFVKTDPQKVINEFVEHHQRMIDTDIRESVRAQYGPQFDWLEDQAKAYSRVETSRFGGNFQKLEQEGKNPYLSYIKTALNISRINENPLWMNANKFLDEAVSKAVEGFQTLWPTGKNAIPSAEQLTQMNQYLKKYGLNTGYYDAATTLLVNHTAPKNVVSQFVRGANAVLSRLTLGLDPLNALNNFLGANILRGTELKQVTDAIKSGDEELAGALAKLGKLDVTGQGDLVLAPAKMIAKSLQKYAKILGGSLPEADLAFYKNNGFIRDITDQFKSIVNDFTLTGAESSVELGSRLQRAMRASTELAERGQIWTGNKVSEEANRFISADVMKNITDLAVQRGLMTPKEALSYINTFVNRVEGNTIASQRPLVFQGPIGQAIGLFQSYQFNLMQQMFRYVSEGSGKDAALLMGLQGTFYGIQGLPAFQAINQHIIGTASGNSKHVDLYDATYGIAGKNFGDLLTYGIPSNLLQTNLYSRGDINPRQVTIIPTALNEVPFVGALTKFFTNLKDTANKISAGGGVWQTLLQGIEHNGVSRPLAGLAQTLQFTTEVGTPMSTTSKGGILFTNDLVSLASLTRLAGGRPLDEAIISDGIFRIHTYQQADRAKMANLAEAIKTTSIAGSGMPDQEQWIKFSEGYAKAGGRQINFNKFMIDTIRSSSTNEAEKIISQLQNPFAQKVQVLMGGPLSGLSD